VVQGCSKDRRLLKAGGRLGLRIWVLKHSICLSPALRLVKIFIQTVEDDRAVEKDPNSLIPPERDGMRAYVDERKDNRRLQINMVQ
jgi:hypothetical protein